MALEFPNPSQVITTDQRLTCGKSIEARFYKIKRFKCFPCYKCGIDLSAEDALKFNKLKLEFNNVLPCCNGACAVGL